MVCYNHVDFDPRCRACREGSSTARGETPLRWWGLVLVGAFSFGVGIVVGLVSVFINSHRDVFLALLALAFFVWLAYRADTLFKARAQLGGWHHLTLGTVDLAGSALAAAMGLAAAGDVTAGLLLGMAVAVLGRLRLRKRRRCAVPEATGKGW